MQRSYSSCTPFEDKSKTICQEVQFDPYSHLLTNYDRQMAKQFPLRCVINFAGMSIFSLYYLSKHHEINRIKNLKFTFDMVFNVSIRAIIGFLFADIWSRKLFVNYDKIQQHKVANNEIRKIMRTFPNARPLLKPHQKPNSYYYAL